MLDIQKAQFLISLVDSLSEATEKMKEAYDRKDYAQFNKIKKFVLNLQEQISGIIGA